MRSLKGLTPFGVVSAVVAVVFTLLALYPLSRVFVGLFWDGGPTLAPIRRAFTEPGIFTLILTTVAVVAGSGLIALLVGSALAWLNERTDARMGILTDSLPLVPFLVPAVAGAVGWVLLLSPRSGLLNHWIRQVLDLVGIEMVRGPFDIYTWYGLIFVYALYAIPYVFLLVTAGLRNLDPSLEEQSRVCGHGQLRTFFSVTLPVIKPSIGAAILLVMWSGFALFSVPAIIGTPAGIEVLSVRIVRALRFTYPADTELAIGLSFFVILFVGSTWYAQTRILRSARHGTVSGKGLRVKRVELGHWRTPLRLLMVSYIFVAAILPFIGLGLVALHGFWNPNIDYANLSFEKIRSTLFSDRTTRRALTNSLRLSVVGGIIGISAAALIALYVRRLPGPIGRAVDAGVKVPATISNVVIAVGFILAFGGSPFNLGGTVLILLMAYIAMYLPQASVAADAAVGQVGKELPEASQTSGAGRSRTFVKIYLPLMMPGLVAGWSLLFVRMVGDLSASAILAGTSNPVVGSRILEVYTNGSYATLAALAIALTVVSSSVVITVLFIAKKMAPWQDSGKS